MLCRAGVKRSSPKAFKVVNSKVKKSARFGRFFLMISKRGY